MISDQAIGSDKMNVDSTAISPLEPLDPDKFHNIMLDKPENCQHNTLVNITSHQKREVIPSSSKYIHNEQKITGQDDVDRKAVKESYGEFHSQSAAFNSQNVCNQANLHQRTMQPTQQYYPQSAPMHVPLQYGMPYSAIPQSAQGDAPVSVVTTIVQQQQQQCGNYGVAGQQWIQPPPQYSQQSSQHSTVKQQMPQPIIPQQPYYNSSENNYLMAYPQQLTPSSHNLPKQTISQEYNYQMITEQSHQNQSQQPNSSLYNQSNFVSYVCPSDSRQLDYSNQHNIITQQNQIKKISQNIPETIHSTNNSEYIRNQLTNNADLPLQQQKNQALRMPIQMNQKFIGNDLTTLNPEICLAGCVFLLIDDCNSQFVDSFLLPTVIRYYGGDLESNNPRGIPERVTHIIVSSWLDNETLIHQALNTTFIDRVPRKLKRVVTISWLNDVLEKRRVDPPTKACHLPTFWSVLKQTHPQICSKIISIAGYDKGDTIVLKYMIQSIGASFCDFTPKTNFFIINRSQVSDEIIQKAVDNKVNIVNFRWLLELYFGNINVLSASEFHRFFPNNENSATGITLTPQYLAKLSEYCHKFMLPWTQPILINDEIIKAAYEIKRTILNDSNIFPEKLFRITGNGPTEEQIKRVASLIVAYDDKRTKVSVLIEGLLKEQILILSKKVRFLGGRIAESIKDCTHFVTPNLRKSVNLLYAIALGKNIVTPLWIETSFTLLEFVDSLAFFVKDRENERKFGFSLKATVLRTRHRRIFQDVKFHISKNVVPSFDMIKLLIESAGGKIQCKKPKKSELYGYIQNDETFFIICNRNDLPFYNYLLKCNFPIFNEDFVITAILRHKIDISTEFHAYPTIPLPVATNNVTHKNIISHS